MKVLMGFCILLGGCCSGMDCGLIANLETRKQYVQFLRDHPQYDPYRNHPYTFDPEDGGWKIR